MRHYSIEKVVYFFYFIFLLQHKAFRCKEISQTWQLGQEVGGLSPVSDVSPSPHRQVLNWFAVSAGCEEETYHKMRKKRLSEHVAQWHSWTIKLWIISELGFCKKNKKERRGHLDWQFFFFSQFKAYWAKSFRSFSISSIFRYALWNIFSALQQRDS